MRALTSDFDSLSPADGFLGVLDQFAALRTYAGGAPTASGYRMLSPIQNVRRSKRAIPAPNFAVLAARASARMRKTGFLSVLFVVGLGVAVLAGPANCPCSSEFNIAQHSSLARMGYVQTALLVSPQVQSFRAADVAPEMMTETLIEPDGAASGVSPITTSALEPSREAISARRDDLSSLVAGRLPSEIIPLSDAGPTVRVAALSNTASDALNTLPMIEVETPTTEAIANDEEKVTAAPSTRTHRKRALRAYRSPVGGSGRQAHRPRDPQLAQRAPRWAQQMYVSPWQSQAFSYTR
ncbi:MAG: hypothetical protein WC829_15855 [Hyphomicrobium sp.]|jgi:hypothetical protein